MVVEEAHEGHATAAVELVGGVFTSLTVVAG